MKEIPLGPTLRGLIAYLPSIRPLNPPQILLILRTNQASPRYHHPMQEHQPSQRQHQVGHAQLAVDFQVFPRVMLGVVGLRPNCHTLPMKLKDRLIPTSRVNRTLQPHRLGHLYPEHILLLRSARFPSL